MRDNFLRQSITVTPSDTDDIVTPGRGLYVGVSGDVKVTYVSGVTDTLTNLAAGMWHPMEVKRIFASGTDATDIHIGW